MTNKVGRKGQVVIPKPMRDRLGIAPGDEVIFWVDGAELRVRRAGRESLRGLLEGTDATAQLEAEHRWELEKEERRDRRLG